MGTIAGGEYGSVKVSGMGKCTGDLTAQSLSVSGKFTCQGKLKVGKLTCSGTADFGGCLLYTSCIWLALTNFFEQFIVYRR